MKIHYKRKSINIFVKKVSDFERFSGLMFRSKETMNLLFDFPYYTNMSLHSWFVFFPFLAVWLDKKNNVLDFKIVKPFCLSVNSKKIYRKFIEIPLNTRNKKIIKFFRRKGKI